MSFTQYVKTNIGGLLLVFVSAWAMAQVGFNAFFVDAGLQHGAVAPVATAVLVAVLFAIAYKRAWTVSGTAAYVVLLAAGIVVASVTSTNGAAYVDEEGSNLYFALVIIFSATACFLLTRTLAGSAVWLIASVFLCSVVQAFYEQDEVVFSMVVLFSALALVVYRNFHKGVMGADAVRKVSHVGNFVSVLWPVAAAGAVGLVVWFGIVAPLNPGVLEIKLITDHRQLPVIELQGVSNTQPNYNTDMTNSELNESDTQLTTDQLLQGKSKTEIDANTQTQQQQGDNGGGSSAGTQSELDQSSTEQQFDAVSYSLNIPFMIIAIIVAVLIIAAIVAFFVLRRRRRTARLAEMLQQEPRAQVVSLYNFLLERLARIGFKVPQGMTLQEWAFNQERRMDDITAETHVNFADVTSTYTTVVYSKREPDPEEIVPLVAFYQGFWKAARSQLGNLKYFFKSFKL